MHRYRQRTAENHRKNYYSERGSRPFRKIKDSAFRMLFSDKKNLLLLYKTLHPEDKDVTVDDLETITLETVLAKDIVNDLGFNVRGRLVILVEAQSTFSMNIIPRSLMYLARTYENYFKEKSENLYGTKTVNMPKPELYVIYTGNKNVKDKIVLSEEFFGGEQTDLEVRVNILTEKDGNQNDIINQYIVFSKTIDEQIKLYGRTARAVLEAIRICKGKDVLREFLEKHEKEVVDTMTYLYDQRAIFYNYMKSERKEGKEEGREEGITETTLSNIKSLIKNLNFSAEKAMQTLGVPLSERDMYLSML